jgi:archaemetzincin
VPEVRIAVVPVGRIDPAEIEDVLSRVVKLLNRAIELRESVPLPKTAEDVSRGQFRSNIVLAEARAALPRLKVSKLVGAAPGSAPVATPQPTAAIFITDVDLYSPSTEAVMAQADTKQRAAIVSVRRLREAFYRRKADPAKQRARLVKEVLRAIGTLHGLPECRDPSCALSVTQVLVDIDRKAERYCGTCWKRLTTGTIAI